MTLLTLFKIKIYSKQLSKRIKENESWRKRGVMEGRKEAGDELVRTIKFAVKQAMREYNDSLKEETV